MLFYLESSVTGPHPDPMTNNIESTSGPCKCIFMAFGEKIRTVCKLEGINLKKFSELTGIPYQSIKNYVAGRHEPPHSRILQISEVPQFAKYKSMLLSTDEIIGEDPEIMALIRRCEELGIADEAADVIRALLKTAERG